MTEDQHRQKHVALHKAMDELFADFIAHNPDLHNYTEQPIMALLKWSHKQTIQPDEFPLATLQDEASRSQSG